MRQRIDLNPDLPTLQIPGRVLNELCAHALETQPEECCGLIAGTRQASFVRVYRCRNEMTRMHRSDPVAYPREAGEAYYMNETDFLTARKDAEAAGQLITGVYHSHVEAGVHFSEMDQEFAEQPLFPIPEASHFVMAMWEGRVAQVGVFERDPASGRYSGRAVEAAPL